MPFSYSLILLHSERPKLYTILAFLSAIGLMEVKLEKKKIAPSSKFFTLKVATILELQLH